MKEHFERIHEGKTILDAKCETCNKQFPHVKNLKDHIRKVHEGKKPPKNFMCDPCGTSCVTPSKLKVHVEAVHERKKPFRCEMCSKSFSSKPCLTKHVSKVHSIKT